LAHKNNEFQKAFIFRAGKIHLFTSIDHPNLRAFISHCGLNSVGEASRAGVPVVAIPLFADQAYNAIAIEYTGMAVRLNILELNGGPKAEELIFDALNKVGEIILKNKNKDCVCKGVFLMKKFLF
jgi:UDP:flavonoid glycosyltransferase YjiC (YdhE family)